MPGHPHVLVAARHSTGGRVVQVFLYGVPPPAPDEADTTHEPEPLNGESTPADSALDNDDCMLTTAAAAIAREAFAEEAETLQELHAAVDDADGSALLGMLCTRAARAAATRAGRGGTAADAHSPSSSVEPFADAGATESQRWFAAGATTVRAVCQHPRWGAVELCAVSFYSGVPAAAGLVDRSDVDAVIAAQGQCRDPRADARNQLLRAWRCLCLTAVRVGATMPAAAAVTTPSTSVATTPSQLATPSPPPESPRLTPTGEGPATPYDFGGGLLAAAAPARVEPAGAVPSNVDWMGLPPPRFTNFAELAVPASEAAVVGGIAPQRAAADVDLLNLRPTSLRSEAEEADARPAAKSEGRKKAAPKTAKKTDRPARRAASMPAPPGAAKSELASIAPAPRPPAPEQQRVQKAPQHPPPLSRISAGKPPPEAQLAPSAGERVGGRLAAMDALRDEEEAADDASFYHDGIIAADVDDGDAWPPEEPPDEDNEEEDAAASSEADSEAAIDELFADLETAVKYLGAALHHALRPPSRPRYAVPVLLRAIVAIVVAVVAAVVVVLPTFFAVLAVRMVKVETSKESFVRRAAIIAAETVAQHTARLGRLAARALPLVLLLWAVPPVALYAVLPALDGVDAKARLALGVSAALTGLVTVMQLQGTVRAAVTHRASGEARAKTHAAAARVVQRWWRRRKAMEIPRVEAAVAALVVTGALPAVCDVGAGDSGSYSPHSVRANTAVVAWPDRSGAEEAPSVIQRPGFLPDAPEFAPPPPPPWHRNVALYVALAVEAVQVTLFAAQFLFVAPDTPFDVGAVPPWLRRLVPYVLVTVPDPALVRPWVAVGGVALAVALVVGRLLYEVVVYHRAVESGSPAVQAEGEAAFFHGFTGSVLYGHGNPRAVPAALCTAAQLLCDTLFFSLLGSLAGSFSCFDATADGATVFGSDVACFSGRHVAALCASLTAFGYYVPLAILVAPVLAEANKPPGGGCTSTVKPFTMATNAAKCVAVLASTFASRKVWAGIGCGLALTATLLALSTAWAAATRLAQPTTSARVNVVRTVTGAGAAVASVLAALAASEGATGLSARGFFVGLAVTIGGADVVGPIAVACLVRVRVPNTV